MPYQLLYHLLPEVAQAETRTVTVLPGSGGDLPADNYAFCEMFCDEPGCDCRRAFFTVMSDARPNEMLAVIAYGWESRDYYRRWFRHADPGMIDDLKGPVLNFGSPQSGYAPALLDLFKRFLLTDAAYIERVKRHYQLFRAQIEDVRDTAPPPKPRAALPNAPCPCGSGKKYKRCCG